MEELYIQTYGNIRIVYVKGWTRFDVILEDLKSSLVYAMNWDIFFKYHKKFEPFKCNINEYVGPNLDIKY